MRSLLINWWRLSRLWEYLETYSGGRVAFLGFNLSIFGACSHFLEFYLLTLRGGLCHNLPNKPQNIGKLNCLLFITYQNKMQNYLGILKKCQTLASASRVYVAVMLDKNLTKEQKAQFEAVYIEYVQGLTK